MRARTDFHLDKNEKLEIKIASLYPSGLDNTFTLRINAQDSYDGVTIFATAEQIWDALKDLDLSEIEPRNMLEEQIGPYPVDIVGSEETVVANG